MSRDEASSRAEVRIGNTSAVAVIRGEITTPFPDRPTEGIIHFNADVSVKALAAGVTQSEITRLLERSIRESDAIDTESLCVVGGEKVWMIICDVRLFDYGGSAIDACLYACMGALRAFRKPEISLQYVGDELSTMRQQLTFHSADEREPLPLALHHTPISISLGIFKGVGHQLTVDEVRINRF